MMSTYGPPPGVNPIVVPPHLPPQSANVRMFPPYSGQNFSSQIGMFKFVLYSPCIYGLCSDNFLFLRRWLQRYARTSPYTYASSRRVF